MARKSVYRTAKGWMVAVDHGERVRLLTSLCRELTALGLRSVMSDARPALSVHADPDGAPLWISVSFCGGFYECCADAGHRLRVSDPETAAMHIVDHARPSGDR